MTPILRTAIRAALARVLNLDRLNSRLLQLTAASGEAIVQLSEEQLFWQDISVDVAEKSSTARYPSVLVHCEKIKNTFKQKFARFSGTATIAVEARVTGDRSEGLEEQTQNYVDAIVALLEASKGNWEEGIYYPGTYEVVYGPLRPGGKRFLKTARVSFELEMHVD